jgi:hypothetical protein
LRFFRFFFFFTITRGRFEVIPLLEPVMGTIIRLVNSHS